MPFPGDLSNSEIEITSPAFWAEPPGKPQGTGEVRLKGEVPDMDFFNMVISEIQRRSLAPVLGPHVFLSWSKVPRQTFPTSLVSCGSVFVSKLR